MKTSKIFGFLISCFILISTGNLKANNRAEEEIITVPAAVVIDKIRGGMLGQNLAVLNGLEHEGSYINEPGNVKNYVPALPDGAWTNDGGNAQGHWPGAISGCAGQRGCRG